MTEYRRLMMPAFTPDAVEKETAPAREMAARIDRQLLSQWRMRVHHGFRHQMPMLIFLNMCDLPLGDFDRLLHNANDNSRGDASNARARLE